MYVRWVECPGALFIVLCSHDLTDITPEVGKHTETSRIELPWMDTHTTHTHTHTHTVLNERRWQKRCHTTRLTK